MTASRNCFRVGTVVLLIAAGCAEPPAGKDGKAKSDAAKPGEQRYTVAVIPKGTTHEFWKSVHAGALQAKKELGNVDIVWQGPVREDDRAQQIQVVENMVNRGVHAIVLAPLDRTALVTPVQHAADKKLPVVIIDSELDSPVITSYIATDNFNGGAIAARQMGKLLGGKGNVVVLRYAVGSASTEAREEGFLKTIEKEFPEIKVISANQHAGATRNEAIAAAENLAGKFGEQIDGWFAPNESVTFGSMVAIGSKGLAKVKLIGFDAGEAITPAVRDGKVAAIVVQDPVRMGYLGVKTAIAALKGEPVEKRISTGENLVTKDNMEEPRIKALLAPDLAGADKE